MRRTMRRAAQIARESGHDYLGTEHVLLALLEDSDGIAGGVAARLDFTDRLRDGVRRVMDSPGYSGSPGT